MKVEFAFDLPAVLIHVGKLHFSAGWFSGEFFKLLNVVLVEVDEGYLGLVHLQVAKFVISLNVG